MSTHRVAPVSFAAARGEEWTWQDHDTEVLTKCICFGSLCLLLGAGVLCASVYARRHCRGNASLGVKKHESTGDVVEDGTAGEATPLLDRNERKKLVSGRWRIIALFCIGLSPLTNCILLGETFDNVLLAMMGMHWGCMVLLPAIYYAFRVFEDDENLTALVAVYKEFFAKQHHDALRKYLRGSVIGLCIFLSFTLGYYMFRCATFKWPFCIHNFEKPLEHYGFKEHSMPFRFVAALYFTFWNPLIEETFWRVFLYRELAREFGVPLDETSDSQSSSPWNGLWQNVLENLPCRRTGESSHGLCTSWIVKWGVNAMYASYHTWPIKVVFQDIWMVYVLFGFAFLVCLGRGFLFLMENYHFGFPAAYAVHAWVDAAFAVLVLCDLHPMLRTLV